MPKNKTHSGMKKRVKPTGSGKLLHPKGRRRTHLLQKQGTGRSRLDRADTTVAKADTRRVRKLLGR